ncbi:hypothetical protein F3Y22_tig00110303pilonHSYRG00172 [Hibiscus syriacus]|uniref:PUM-HD domain-containing protein n=1 Tax=Hibiscus syriacus TaxID=106335 RepID=A0A6A3B5D7_HIBSY|nr:hypothetical protein F3Y22_tig00110303pilonHSYRG00172 [Hibiscus syriacus]
MICSFLSDQCSSSLCHEVDFKLSLIETLLFIVPLAYHVLEHGKPHERSSIISKLAGQILKMSQQKFASNVVEKYLTFGGLEERQILVNEMLGSTDENEPLQATMKDQFGNYVVQKVLETCDDQIDPF